jgi:hypothetical protein
MASGLQRNCPPNVFDLFVQSGRRMWHPCRRPGPCSAKQSGPGDRLLFNTFDSGDNLDESPGIDRFYEVLLEAGRDCTRSASRIVPTC